MTTSRRAAEERTEEQAGALAAAAARLAPGLRRCGPLQRTLKSHLLPGRIGSQPVLVKHLTRDQPPWSFYFVREVELYRRFEEQRPPVRAPRLFTADDARRLLVLERLAGQPLSAPRRHTGALTGRELAAVLEICQALEQWTTGLELTPMMTPDPPTRAAMRRRLLEDPSAPRAWVREGIERCASLGLLEAPDAELLLGALDDHDVVGFGHGDLLPRNLIVLDGGLGLVDWECAGAYPRDWDRALLWANLPAARAGLEEQVQSGSDPARFRAFLAAAAFALARELKFRRRGRGPETDDRRGRLLEGELRSILDRLGP